jgi:hypothetical protein
VAAFLAAGGSGGVRVTVRPEVAEALRGPRGRALVELSARSGREVLVEADPDLTPEEVRVAAMPDAGSESGAAAARS